MNDCDRLIEDILDQALLHLQAAASPAGRREILALMNYIKGKRSRERVRQMERASMARALGE